MGCIYVGCIGIALTGARPNVSNTLTVIWLISAFTVCLVAPTIEWFLQAMYTTASYELNLKVFYWSIPYYAAYLFCSCAWAYMWLGLIGVALTIALEVRLVKGALEVE